MMTYYYGAIETMGHCRTDSKKISDIVEKRKFSCSLHFVPRLRVLVLSTVIVSTVSIGHSF